MIFCLISLNLCEKFEPPSSSSRKRFRSVAKKDRAKMNGEVQYTMRFAIKS